MNNKLNTYIIGIAFLIDGFYSFFTHNSLLKTIVYNTSRQEYSLLYSYIILFIGVGIIIYAYFFQKEKNEIYTICPTCKESFTYKDLKDGKCPYCNDVKTIEIEEYYKTHPEEKGE